MGEQNKAVAIKFIKAFSDGDAATAKACLASDAQTVAKDFGKLSGRRPYALIVATTATFKDTTPTGLQPDFLTVTSSFFHAFQFRKAVEGFQ